MYDCNNDFLFKRAWRINFFSSVELLISLLDFLFEVDLPEKSIAILWQFHTS